MWRLGAAAKANAHTAQRQHTAQLGWLLGLARLSSAVGAVVAVQCSAAAFCGRCALLRQRCELYNKTRTLALRVRMRPRLARWVRACCVASCEASHAKLQTLGHSLALLLLRRRRRRMRRVTRPAGTAEPSWRRGLASQQPASRHRQRVNWSSPPPPHCPLLGPLAGLVAATPPLAHYSPRDSPHALYISAANVFTPPSSPILVAELMMVLPLGCSMCWLLCVR